MRLKRKSGIYSVVGQGLAALSVTIAAAIGLSGLLPGAAIAKNDKVLYVGHSTAGNNTGCSSPGYTSVQAAINAASDGQEVYLCGGQFAEQVFITKSITLTGDASSGLTAVGAAFSTNPADFPPQFTNDALFVPQALVVVSGNATNASIDGLTVSGPMPGNGGCGENEFGVLALGGSVSLSKDTIVNIADTNSGLYGCQFGVGVQIGRYYWPKQNFSGVVTEDFAAHADIDHVTVTGYQKNGITIDGTGTTATVNASDVTGGGRGIPFGSITAQNGIQLGRGATGVIQNNSVSNNSYSGPGVNASSAGILVFGGCGDPLTTNVTVKHNGLINNDVGVYTSNSQADCTNPPTTVTNNTVVNNEISNDLVANQSPFTDVHGTLYNGYQVGIDEQGNGDTVSHNKISGTGYASQQSAPLPFVLPIDTISYPTTNVDLDNNTFDGSHI